MKSNVMPSIVQIEANQLKQLVSEVKETVATGVVQVSKAKRKASNFVFAFAEAQAFTNPMLSWLTFLLLTEFLFAHSRNKTFFLQIIMFLYCDIKVDHHLTCSKYFCSFLSTRYTPRNPHFVAEILIDPAISKS